MIEDRTHLRLLSLASDWLNGVGRNTLHYHTARLAMPPCDPARLMAFAIANPGEVDVAFWIKPGRASPDCGGHRG